MSYIARSDIETLLNITLTENGQALVDALIPAVEAYAESYCNRSWSPNTNPLTFTETFDGGATLFFPKHHPITEVVSVTTDGYPLNLPTTNVYNYGTHLRFGVTPSYLPQGVTITYKASIKIPDDLKHALIRWVADIFKSSQDAGKTTKKVTVGTVSVDYLAQDGIPLYVEMVLKKYRQHPI